MKECVSLLSTCCGILTHILSQAKQKYLQKPKIHAKIFILDTNERIYFEHEIPYLIYTNMFNLEQVKNIDKSLIPEVIDFKSVIYSSNVTENKINEYCRVEGIKQIYGGDAARYVHPQDEIHMPLKEDFKNDEAFYNSYFHEIIHSSGVEKRLNRDMKNSFGSKSYAREELVAEIGANYLCAENGIENNFSNSLNYIAGWKSKAEQDKYLFIKSFSAAEKACEFVNERMKIKEKQVEFSR